MRKPRPHDAQPPRERSARRSTKSKTTVTAHDAKLAQSLTPRVGFKKFAVGDPASTPAERLADATVAVRAAWRATADATESLSKGGLPEKVSPSVSEARQSWLDVIAPLLPNGTLTGMDGVELRNAVELVFDCLNRVKSRDKLPSAKQLLETVTAANREASGTISSSKELTAAERMLDTYFKIVPRQLFEPIDERRGSQGVRRRAKPDPLKRADHEVNRSDGRVQIRADKALVEEFEARVQALGIQKKQAIEEALRGWLAEHTPDQQ